MLNIFLLLLFILKSIEAVSCSELDPLKLETVQIIMVCSWSAGSLCCPLRAKTLIKWFKFKVRWMVLCRPFERCQVDCKMLPFRHHEWLLGTLNAARCFFKRQGLLSLFKTLLYPLLLKTPPPQLHANILDSFHSCSEYFFSAWKEFKERSMSKKNVTGIIKVSAICFVCFYC